jgi:HSP20 family protein
MRVGPVGWMMVGEGRWILMTTLVRWNPFRELELIDRRMGRIAMPLMPAPFPAADVYETKDEFIVDHVLTVKGEHKQAIEETEKAYRLQERLEREFERRFELPTIFDTEKLTATFKHGVLELHAPRVEAAVPKKIPIAL